LTLPFQRTLSPAKAEHYAWSVADERHVALVGSSRELTSTGLIPVLSYISDEG